MAMERLPKGFGAVVKLSGNRRNKYVVRIKTGVVLNKEKEKAYPEYKILGYVKSKKDGISLLERYHNDPYLFDNNLTFKEMYKKAFDEYIKDQSHSTILAYEASFKACPSLHNMIFKDIKVIHLQTAIDTCGKNYPTIRKIKIMFNVVYKYAMKYDLCSKDYSKFIDIARYKDKNPNAADRNPFSKDDVKAIWTFADDRWYQIVLMLIYTGVRITELLELKKENINLEEQYFDVTHSKTENGIRRVPIADCVLPFFKEWYEYSQADTLLCTPEMNPFKYRNYYDSYWKPILEQINLSKFTPHCTRHTCISLLAEAKIEPTTIKKIVGHSGAMALTERVYTHLDVSILVNAVNQMYVPSSIKK